MNHFDLTNPQFEQQFENCTLAPSLFSHEAHLRLAWIHITQYGIEQALENIPRQIVNFVDNLGARDKYNQTLTIAAIKAVYHFVLQAKSKEFKDFIQEFPQLTTNFKGLLASHYSVDIFTDTQAKRDYVAPDLLPFD